MASKKTYLLAFTVLSVQFESLGQFIKIIKVSMQLKSIDQHMNVLGTIDYTATY